MVKRKNKDGEYRPKAEKIPPKPKDGKAPKRPMSAYFAFAGDNRKKMQAKHPKLKIGQIAKKLGQEWKAMSAQKKKKYVDQANKAMEVYKVKAAKHRESAYYKRFRSQLAQWNEDWKFAAQQQKEDKKAAKAKKKVVKKKKKTTKKKTLIKKKSPIKKKKSSKK